GSSALLMRTIVGHYMSEVCYKGSHVISEAPDIAENAKFAYNLLARHPGSMTETAIPLSHAL
ncbi:hypothetical protein, partial [Staphylococcus aureus]